MVAREPRAPRHGNEALRQLFIWWTSALGAGARPALDAVRACGSALDRLRRRDYSPLASWPVFVLAVSCVLFGALVRIAMSPSGPDRITAATAGVATLGWALARLGLMVLVVGTSEGAIRRARGAWATGAAVWMIALSPLAAIAAWAASGVISFLTLKALGERAARARRAVLVAWGLQAAVSIASWLVVNGWFATLLR